MKYKNSEIVVKKPLEIISILKNGGVGVIPTDTLYGLVGLAFSRKAVTKIYRLKNRDPKKPLIILIKSLNDLVKFKISLKPQIKKYLNLLWPSKVSIILPCRSPKLFYLHRGTNSLAFRLPRKKPLLKILKMAGPLVAPSANPEGKPPAKAVKEALKYFGNKIDFCLDGGKLKSVPSTLLKISYDSRKHKIKFAIERKGAEMHNVKKWLSQTLKKNTSKKD